MSEPTPPPADALREPPESAGNGPALSAADDQAIDIAGTEADEESAANRALREDTAPADDPTSGPLGDDEGG